MSPPFGGMIAFVKEAEALQEKGQLERLKNEEGELKVGGWGGAACSEEGGRGQGGKGEEGTATLGSESQSGLLTVSFSQHGNQELK